MVGIYLSGTGNTKHCIEKLLSELDQSAKAIAIEEQETTQAIKENDFIILAYPTQYSNIPYMVRDFIHRNAALWKGKKVLCMSTMGLFSGDAAGCSARLLKKYGAIIVGGLHLKMPDSVCDVKALKRKQEVNRSLVKKADQKIIKIAADIKNGKYPKDGIFFYDHIAGLISQRLWFYRKTYSYSNRLKISDACIGCGQCAANCPMHNLTLIQNVEPHNAKSRNTEPHNAKSQVRVINKPIQNGKCTMCYRCISTCPKKAITLVGKEVKEQCRYENYQ